MPVGLKTVRLVFDLETDADDKTKARLVELSDRVQVLQVEALCWCGARAIHNARTVDGERVEQLQAGMRRGVHGTLSRSASNRFSNRRP